MLTNSTGSPHTAGIAQDLVDDDMLAIPLSWYSGWADPAIGQNVFEVQANYCIEAMNGVDYMSQQHGDKVAVVGFPGDYGEDGSIGAKLAIEQLGLELVFDGQAQVIPGADQTPIIAGIVESGADFVWLTTGPTQTAEIIGGAALPGTPDSGPATRHRGTRAARIRASRRARRQLHPQHLHAALGSGRRCRAWTR